LSTENFTHTLWSGGAGCGTMHKERQIGGMDP
jgi:hypothetical protein